MNKPRILVTGGAGFIGSFLTDRLIELGHAVTIYDNLETQVHLGRRPEYLNPKAKFIKGDVRDYPLFGRSLHNIDIVYHLASRVGVGQSNYQIKDYIDANIGGTANLLDWVINSNNKVKKIIMTASMSSYGEGNYRCSKCGSVRPGLRNSHQLRTKSWELRCPCCHRFVDPIATSEDTPANNNSVYALSKNVQENLLMMVGKMYNLPVVALRCFNVYGPRQSLSNPYTGVTAIFISRLKNNNPPVVYEDGLQTRDFVSVHDVVEALVKSMGREIANWQVINIGSGKPTSIKEVAITLASLLKRHVPPLISGKWRKGDVRHCFADIHLAKKLLNWEPKLTLEKGFSELITWSEKQNALDLFEQAEKELRNKSLV